MPPAKVTITIHMVSSLDGMIASKDNSVSWFETGDFFEKGATDDNAAELLRTIDCYVMGSRTYEQALELSKTYGWPYGDTPTIVLTRRDLPIARPNIELYSGDLEVLVNARLTATRKNVWVVGGPATAKRFLKANLADEIRMSVLPVILGDGMPFFDHIGQERSLHLLNITAYRTGMVELHYQIRK